MNQKMHIIQVTNHFWPCIGGIETVVWNTSKELVKQGHSVRVVCLNTCAKSNEKLVKQETIEGIEIVRLPYVNLKYYLIAPKVTEHVKDADIIHVHGLGFFSDYLLWNKKKIGKPIVISTHGGIFHTKKLNEIKQFYFNGMEKKLLKKADAVIAVSKKDWELFSQIVDKEKLHLVENGIPLDEFSKLPCVKEKNTFLFVGRFSKNKRLDLLVDVFGGIQKKIPNAKLWIIGKDFDGIENEIKKTIKEKKLESCVFLEGEKNRKELLEYYSRAEFFISASEYEGFGVSLIEAMAAGCIPLVNKIQTFEDILENGKNGFLIDFKNFSRNNPIKGSTLAGITHERVKKSMEQYSIKKGAHKIIEIYAHVRT